MLRTNINWPIKIKIWSKKSQKGSYDRSRRQYIWLCKAQTHTQVLFKRPQTTFQTYIQTYHPSIQIRKQFSSLKTADTVKSAPLQHLPSPFPTDNHVKSSSHNTELKCCFCGFFVHFWFPDSRFSFTVTISEHSAPSFSEPLSQRTQWSVCQEPATPGCCVVLFCL